MTARLTPWFGGNSVPGRAGVYERALPSGGSAYWFWTGKYWAHGGNDFASDCAFSERASESQNLPWRGLASDPAVSK